VLPGIQKHIVYVIVLHREIVLEVCQNPNFQEYAAANKQYMDITIGKTAWHNDVALSEARHNKGSRARKVSKSTGTDFMENEETKRWEKFNYGWELNSKELWEFTS
jgi:hypothetical protein